MERMTAGYKHFREHVFPEQKSHFKSLAESQAPHTLFITCADSRVVPTLFTQTEPGELFLCRVVGNLVPAHGSEVAVASSIEYAVTVLKVRHIVVCGHSDCGAMRAFLHPEKLASLKTVSSWLEHAKTAIEMTHSEHSDLEGEDFVEALIEENVIAQLQHLRTHPSVATALRQGSLEVHGWVYDIGSGQVKRFDEDGHRFVDLASAPRKPVEAAEAKPAKRAKAKRKTVSK